jgi:hypothetical protein
MTLKAYGASYGLRKTRVKLESDRLEGQEGRARGKGQIGWRARWRARSGEGVRERGLGGQRARVNRANSEITQPSQPRNV